MVRVVLIVGIILCVFGLSQAVETYFFLQRAQLVQAKVVSIQELRGPPKPRQKTPIHLLYTGSDSSEVSALAHLPMLYQIKQGDEIRVLVDPKLPSIARMPLWSELWARPLTYLIGGILISIVGRVLRAKRMR